MSNDLLLLTEPIEYIDFYFIYYIDTDNQELKVLCPY